ncbi:hypothetical protein [Streptomyces sp. NPDC005955]|uniref:hypothetical protein n=1 Tax=Streptomyces sp. NPDC005955 TaxID=3364738 RepID=UPI0036C181A7
MNANERDAPRRQPPRGARAPRDSEAEETKDPQPPQNTERRGDRPSRRVFEVDRTGTARSAPPEGG